MADKNRYLRAQVARGIEHGADGVDREKNVINGFAVMTKGLVKDMRGWEIDDVTLEQIVEAGNEYKLGLKSRFGHPNMSNTALGTFLGRAKNFRIDGDIVRADLHISDSAFKTPDGDLGSYVMDLAEQDPDAFGTSVVLRGYEFEYRLKADGTRAKDEDGNDLPPLLRVKGLSAVDAVDEPAANNGMFGTQFFSDSVIPSAVMTDFLNKLIEQPDALDTIVSFLSRYQANKEEAEIRDEEEKTEKKEGVMDLKELTLEQLKEDRADLVEALHKEGKESVKLDEVKAEALKAERARSSAILGLLGNDAYSGYLGIAEQGVKDGEALEAVEGKMKDQRIQDLESSATETPGPGEGEEAAPAVALSVEEQAKKDWEKDSSLHQEFGKYETYLAYMRHKSKVRVLGK